MSVSVELRAAFIRRQILLVDKITICRPKMALVYGHVSAWLRFVSLLAYVRISDLRGR